MMRQSSTAVGKSILRFGFWHLIILLSSVPMLKYIIETAIRSIDSRAYRHTLFQLTLKTVFPVQLFLCKTSSLSRSACADDPLMVS